MREPPVPADPAGRPPPPAQPSEAAKLEIGTLEATLPPLPTGRDARGMERYATPTSEPEPEDES